jgi:hypothetical protein
MRVNFKALAASSGFSLMDNRWTLFSMEMKRRSRNTQKVQKLNLLLAHLKHRA